VKRDSAERVDDVAELCPVEQHDMTYPNARRRFEVMDQRRRTTII